MSGLTQALAIELPRNNRCARFAFLALFSANASFASLAAVAWPALSAQQLPAVTGADARIVTTSDEGGSIERHGGPTQNARPDYLLKIRLRYSTTLSKTIANVSLNFAF
jgi:hypothetical protein